MKFIFALETSRLTTSFAVTFQNWLFGTTLTSFDEG